MQHQGKALSRAPVPSRFGRVGRVVRRNRDNAVVDAFLVNKGGSGRNGKPLQYSPHRSDNPYGDSSGYSRQPLISSNL